MTAAPTGSVATLLAHPRYEVLPFGNVEEAVLEHVPPEVTLTVTVSPKKGIEHTLDVTDRLTKHGYSVVPHLSARLVRDRAHLSEILQWIDEIGAHDVFVVAGDAGYPESPPLIPDSTTIQAMFDKARFATYIVSQICFDPSLTASWVERVWDRGTRLPIHVGIPGAVPRTKLIRVSSSIGLGASTRFLRRHRSLFAHALRPGGFNPDPLIAGLEPSLADPERKIARFHIFTFNHLP